LLYFLIRGVNLSRLADHRGGKSGGTLVAKESALHTHRVDSVHYETWETA
jgi:hypothetical protein